MITYSIVVSLIIFLAGYIIGKHRGRKTGYNEAVAIMPLELRRQSLENGSCIICGELWLDTTKYEISGREWDTL